MQRPDVVLEGLSLEAENPDEAKIVWLDADLSREQRKQRAMREPHEVLALAAVIMMALSFAPNAALADMLPGLRDSTLGCGMDFFYFSRDGSVLWSDGDARSTTPLTSEAIVEDSVDRLTISAKPPGAGSRAENLTFQRGAKGYSLVIDGSAQECDAAKGMGMMTDSWHDAVRENACGNDPTPECEKELVRLCGKPATTECARRHKAKLDSISASAMARRNRR
jgi:hypothetical protein